MSKYEPLWKYIKDNKKENYKLTYKEIKNIIGFGIDHSFLTYKKEKDKLQFIKQIDFNIKKILFTKTLF